MKKGKLSVMLGVLFVALSTMISCNDNDDTPVLLKAYVKADGNKELVVGEENQEVAAKIVLTDKVDNPLTVELTILDKKGAKVDILNISPAQLTVPKGSNEVTFKLTLKKDASLVEEQRIVIGLVSQELITVAETLEVVAKPALAVQALTPEQKKLVAGYIKKGMDITPFLGKVNVKSTVVFNVDDEERFKNLAKEPITGITVITLSEESTPEQPVLKMEQNPMGLTEFFYNLLKQETIENNEFWYGEYAGPYYAKVMKLINWNKTSEETFTASLDGIKIKENKEITYIGKGKDSYGDEINIVPFDFKYSAWDRLKKLIDEGNTEAKECNEYGATPNPIVFINNSDIATDGYEAGGFIQTTGKINYQAGTMTFDFLSSYTDGSDYIVIRTEYTAK